MFRYRNCTRRRNRTRPTAGSGRRFVAGVLLLFSASAATVSPQTNTIPIVVDEITAAEERSRSVELAATIEETLRLSLAVIDDFDLVDATRDIPRDTVALTGSVVETGDSFQLTVRATAPDTETPVTEVNETADTLFATFSAVDRLVAELLTDLTGRQIAFGSLTIELRETLPEAAVGTTLTIDNETIHTFEVRERSGPRRYTIDRIPAGVHRVGITQSGREIPFSQQVEVDVHAGGDTAITFTVPAVTEAERDRLLTDAYRRVVLSILEPGRWLTTSTHEYATRTELIRALPVQRSSETLLAWSSSVRRTEAEWIQRRAFTVAAAPITVDGTPDEWITVVPLRLNEINRRSIPLASPGALVRSIRLATRNETLHYLITADGPVVPRYRYQIYFTRDDPEHPLLRVTMYPEGERRNAAPYAVELLTTRKAEHGEPLGEAAVGYHVAGRFIEGAIAMPAPVRSTLTGIQEIRVVRDDGIYNERPGGSFSFVEDRVTSPAEIESRRR